MLNGLLISIASISSSITSYMKLRKQVCNIPSRSLRLGRLNLIRLLINISELISQKHNVELPGFLTSFTEDGKSK